MGSKKKRELITKEDQIGYIFGDPIETFPYTTNISELEIVRHYIFKFDEIRGTSWNMSKTQKATVLNCVTDSMMILWQVMKVPSIQRNLVKERVKRIICAADLLIGNGSACKNRDNPKFQEEQKLKFAAICDISASSTLLTPKTSTKKRKVEELVSTVIMES